MVQRSDIFNFERILEIMRPHLLLSDLTHFSKSAVGRGSFRYKSAITKHFAKLTVSLGRCARSEKSSGYPGQAACAGRWQERSMAADIA